MKIFCELRAPVGRSISIRSEISFNRITIEAIMPFNYCYDEFFEAGVYEALCIGYGMDTAGRGL